MAGRAVARPGPGGGGQADEPGGCGGGGGGFRFPDAPRPEEYMPCIRCGLCLDACPTYRLTGEEIQSPRGRVQLVAAVDRGVVPPSAPGLGRTLFDCLDCRACEVACPSGVPIGSLIEKGRGQWVARAAAEGSLQPSDELTLFLVRHVIPEPRRLEALAGLLRLAQRLGLVRLAARFGLLGLLPEGVRAMAEALPVLPGRSGRRRMTGPGGRLDPTELSYEAPGGPVAERGARPTAALFLGCVMDVLLADTNVATARVLARNGYGVAVPAGQRCCGALALHAGERDAARRLARRNVDAFAASGAAFVVTDAGGCGAALLEYPELLAADPVYAPRARDFAARVRDIAQLLVERGFEPPRGRVERSVAYQASCHLHNVMGVRTEPLRLLRAIPGLRVAELADPARCCGSAGIYNLVRPQWSDRFLKDRMAGVPASADALVTGNPGCWLQLRQGARRHGPPVEVLHTIDLLDLAYRREGGGAPARRRGWRPAPASP